MNPALYALLADGRKDFLHDHTRFHEELIQAVERLEQMMEGGNGD